ncbi:MAG: hypothetical protein ACREJN_03205 [Nitrospiraceae bacterium]
MNKLVTIGMAGLMLFSMASLAMAHQTVPISHGNAEWGGGHRSM